MDASRTGRATPRPGTAARSRTRSRPSRTPTGTAARPPRRTTRRRASGRRSTPSRSGRSRGARSRSDGRHADEPPVDDLGRPDVTGEDEQERERDRDRGPDEIDGQRQRALVDRRQAVGGRDRGRRAEASRRDPEPSAKRRSRARERPRAQPGGSSSGGSAATQDEVGDDADDRESRDDREQDVRAARRRPASCPRSGTGPAWRTPIATGRRRWRRGRGLGSGLGRGGRRGRARRRLLDRERQAAALHVAVLGDGGPADHVVAGLEREVGGGHERVAVVLAHCRSRRPCRP